MPKNEVEKLIKPKQEKPPILNDYLTTKLLGPSQPCIEDSTGTVLTPVVEQFISLPQALNLQISLNQAAFIEKGSFGTSSSELAGAGAKN